MFETNYRNSLPGYTGHVPGKVETDVPLVSREARKHIPGKSAPQHNISATIPLSNRLPDM